MTTWLDQVVSELRVAAGQSSFDLALVANVVAPPASTSRDPAGADVSRAARESGSPRPGSLRTRRSACRCCARSSTCWRRRPARRSRTAGWRTCIARRSGSAPWRSRTIATMRSCATRALARAAVFQRRADVRRLQSVVRWVLDEDARLQQRASRRRRRAAGDARRQARRGPAAAARAGCLGAATATSSASTGATVRTGLDRLLGVREWLTDVRQLAGPSPGALRQLSRARDRRAARARRGAAAARSRRRAFDAAGRGRHGGSRASATRFDAVRSGSMDTAWQASSAAAGALMLLDQAIAGTAAHHSHARNHHHVDHSPRHQAAARLGSPHVPVGDCRCGAAMAATARATAIVVPSRSAAEELRRTIEELALPDGGCRRGALVMPDLVTRGELYSRLHAHLPAAAPLLTEFDREVLLRLAAEDAARGGRDAALPAPARSPRRDAGVLRRAAAARAHHRRLDRIIGDKLEAGRDTDRGAERLLQQTRFLAAAFAAFERRIADSGRIDEHALRALPAVGALPVAVPPHLVVTVADQAADPRGLWPVDFDLLSRMPGLERHRHRRHRSRARRRAGTAAARCAAGPGRGARGRGVRGAASRGPAGRPPARSAAGRSSCCRDREEELVEAARWIKRRARDARDELRAGAGRRRVPAAAAVPLSGAAGLRLRADSVSGRRRAAAGRRAVRRRARSRCSW